MIVAADADVEKAARSAVFGALSNSGQACVSVERVYAVDAVYESFFRAHDRHAQLQPIPRHDG